MSLLRRGGLLMSAALFAVACGGGNQPTTAPSTTSTNPTLAPTTAVETSAPATEQPTEVASVEPTTAPSESLDPSLSDAGIVGRATISGDARTDVNRDGTWDIVGVADDGFGSGCSPSFDNEAFSANAYDDSAPEGQVRQMGVTVTPADIPTTDETISGIEDGGVSIEFASEEFFGTSYSADHADDDRTSVTVNVTRSGDQLTFDFTGKTWDGVDIAGLIVCESPA